MGQDLPPGIWFVFKATGVGRYRGSYPVTWQGWCLALGVPVTFMLLAAACVWYLVRNPEANAGLWIAALCAGAIGTGLGVSPVVRRRTDFFITMEDWRARH